MQETQTYSAANIIGYLQGTVSILAQALKDNPQSSEKVAKLLAEALEESERRWQIYKENYKNQ
jgi:hypothetical protein